MTCREIQCAGGGDNMWLFAKPTCPESRWYPFLHFPGLIFELCLFYMELTSWSKGSREEAFFLWLPCSVLHFIFSCLGEDDLLSSVQIAGNAPDFTHLCSVCVAADVKQAQAAAFHEWPVSVVRRHNSTLKLGGSDTFQNWIYCVIWLTFYVLENISCYSGKKKWLSTWPKLTAVLMAKRVCNNRTKRDTHIYYTVCSLQGDTVYCLALATRCSPPLVCRLSEQNACICLGQCYKN